MSEPVRASGSEMVAAPIGRSAADPSGHGAAPPLIAGESAAAYDELLARVSTALQPADVLEEIWVRDVVDLVWDVCRLRRFKADLMAAARYQGMQEMLQPLVEGYEDPLLAKAWAAGREKAIEKVQAKLGQAGVTMEHVAARTFACRIGDFERIERMLMAAEARRAAALAEFDRYRASFSQRLRG